jgi:DNA recombination protein RmuC
MEDNFLLNFFIGFSTAALSGIVLFWYIYNKKIEDIKRKISSIISEQNEESRAVEEKFINLKIEYAKVAEQLNSSKSSKDQLKSEIQNLANVILEKNSQKLFQNNQAQLTNLLKPFKENIQEFNQKIDNYYKDESKERFSLVKEINKLNTLNQKISQDAVNLTNALKGDNKVQGDWGEYILERVLENSGLKKGREYEVQKEFKDSLGNRFRPDVIVHLPDKKDIIIDSKLSLSAYEKYHTAKEGEKDDYLQRHLASLYTHIKELKSKNYHKLSDIQTLDFVLMFIPIEAAFLLAVEKDRQLYERAYSQNIIIVSPSTLLAVLRTIQNSWRYEYQNSNAQLIAKKAGDMYDKFVAFVNDLQGVESSLIKAQSSYENAFKKLSSGKGNLIGRSKQLKELDGVYHKKEQKIE